MTLPTCSPPSMLRPDLWPEMDQKDLARILQKKQLRPIDVWQPQEKQMDLLRLAGLDDALYSGPVQPAMCELIGYGGAAFGGKTEGMVGLALVALHTVPGIKIGYFRRKFKELEGSDGPIERSHVLYPQIGGKYNKTEHSWRFGMDDDVDWNEGSSASLRFCHCQHESDVHMYQSWAFDILMIDEATQFSWPIVSMLLTRTRASRHSMLPHPFAVMCSNPGGVGHKWYKQVFGIRDRLKAGSDT